MIRVDAPLKIWKRRPSKVKYRLGTILEYHYESVCMVCGLCLSAVSRDGAWRLLVEHAYNCRQGVVEKCE